jgi:hypothetical protein
MIRQNLGTKIMKPILRMLLLIGLPMAVQAQVYTYSTNADNTITITNCTGCDGNVTIPDTINDLTVTSIGDSAFESSYGLTGVTIPDTVTSIGNWAFDNCSYLTNVTIPESVTNIGIEAFDDCESLNSISIPNSVTSIGSYAFESCYRLTSITVGNGVTSIQVGMFYDCGRITNIMIGSSVTSIGAVAFGYSGLTSITIPNSVTNIGNGAFEYCGGLTNVTIPDSVSNIGSSAFISCGRLTNITIGNGVTNIGNSAFADCGELIGLYFRGNAPSIGLVLFERDHNPTAYYLPGTTGWANFSTESGLQTVLWNPQAQTCGGSFGAQTNQFGFNINWASGQTVVVEASTNLVDWQPVQTNMLTTGSSYYSDPQWTNYPGRYYRLRSP